MLISFLHSHFSSKAHAPHVVRSARGFTLIELLVVFAIMTVLTAILLFQHQRFESSTLLRSLAYNLALSIRQAQVYGTSVRQFGTSAGSFSYSYGVYFTTQSPETKTYILFADANGNKVYDASPDEKVQLFNLGSGYRLNGFCGINGTNMFCNTCPTINPPGVTTCLGGGSGISTLTVYFKRPNPDALFSSSSGGAVYSQVYLQVRGPSGDTRGITITSTGQISVGENGS